MDFDLDKKKVKIAWIKDYHNDPKFSKCYKCRFFFQVWPPIYEKRYASESLSRQGRRENVE